MKKFIRHTGLSFLILSSIALSCKKEELPTLSTSSITDIKATSATGGGMVTSDGNASVTSRGICWGLNSDPTLSDSKTNDGTGEGQYVSSLTGLTAGSNYHVRAYATNSVGTAYGADLSFATLGKAPECLTQAATNITSSGATLIGTVNANYLLTTVTFEYGTTTNYGQTITSAQSPVTGSNITNVSVDISGLISGTIYHYRVKSVNSIGTTNGNDITFTTFPDVPTVTTTAVIGVIYTSATSGGNVSYDGGSLVIARGVCWSTSTNPTITGEHTINGNGTGSFISKIGCLSYATTYYIRAYATNNVGTAYGNQHSFTTEISPIVFNPNITYGSVSDIDGNCYKTIQIGTQMWMAENLKTTKYNDDTDISLITGDAMWFSDRAGAFCWYNNDAVTYKFTYGALYNWYAVDSVSNGGKNVCPMGWHVPTSAEWSTMEDYLKTVGYYDELKDITLIGKALASGAYWVSSTVEGAIGNTDYPAIRNAAGFTALPGGSRGQTGGFIGIGGVGYWWNTNIKGYYYGVSVWTASDFRSFYPVEFGFRGDGYSVRCLKDQ